jgi:low affinity Fe/Cu permease
MNEIFRKIAHSISRITGSAWAFCIAVLGVLAWGVSGFFFDFSNTWQLFINTGTTILTFLMVFLIQNNQNRDSQATQLKLDELIKALGRARDSFIDVEEDPDSEIRHLEDEFKKLHHKAEQRNGIL